MYFRWLSVLGVDFVMEYAPRLLRIDEAARYLGVSATTVRKLVAPVKLGARVLWDRRDLDAFVDSLRTVAPDASATDRAFGVE